MTFTLFLYKILDIQMSMAAKVPDLPTPALQCTMMGGPWLGPSNDGPVKEAFSQGHCQ